MNNIKYKRLLSVYESWESLSNNIDEFKIFLRNLSENERMIIKKIIILKKINKIIIDDKNNKDKILLSVYLKYKEKILPRFLIFSILKIDSKTIKNLNKELFKLKLLEEQQQIRGDWYAYQYMIEKFAYENPDYIVHIIEL